MREDILETKLEKLKNIQDFGMDSYPEKCERSLTNAEALERLSEISAGDPANITLVGRVKSARPMGGSTFAHIEDGTGKIQIFLNKKNMDEAKYKLFAKNIEIGDFVQVTGKLFLTKQKEKTLEARDWKILAKNIRPIPRVPWNPFTKPAFSFHITRTSLSGKVSFYYGEMTTELLLRRFIAPYNAHRIRRKCSVKFCAGQLPIPHCTTG